MVSHYPVPGVPEGCVWACQISQAERPKWREDLVFPHVQQRIPIWLNIFEKLYGAHPITMLEIGVHEGDWMRAIMDSPLNVAAFTGIDPYSGGPEDPYTGAYWSGREEAQARYEQVLAMYETQGQSLLRTTSAEFAASHAPEPTYDAIFVDGDHRYERCLQDAESYWPFVKAGGLLMFDDYANTDHVGVTRAVNEFIDAHRSDIEIVLYFGCHFTNLKKSIPVLNGQIGIKRVAH